MNLSVSNIAWLPEQDNEVYRVMQENGFTGLEIAPTRVFPDNPFDRLDEALAWSHELYLKYGFRVSSMQSIWYGRKESMFGSEKERDSLFLYTKKAIDFAEAVGCGNLVFGCPKNRNIPPEMTKSEAEKEAVSFFRELGEYAYEHNTVLSLEANPPIYNTNFINDTFSAIEMIRQVNSKGFRLNLDLGTMIQNEEYVETLAGQAALIHHVHISEPGLVPIKKRKIYESVISLLKTEGYDGYVSVEMGRTEDISALFDALSYLKELLIVNG